MVLRSLLSVIPHHEIFELHTRDKLIGAFRKDDLYSDFEHLNDAVFMIEADSSVLVIILV